MSKITLKKELDRLSKEELVEVIMQMYALRKDVKAYFEFYLNPDVEKLFGKYAEAIFKEFRRVKHRNYSAARISKVKALVKDFASFDPGASYVLKLYFVALDAAMSISLTCYLSDAQMKSFSSLLSLAIDYGNKNALFTELMKHIDGVVRSDMSSRVMRRILLDILAEKGIEVES